jgi:hypothetical protein
VFDAFYIVNQQQNDYIILRGGTSGLKWHADGSEATVWTSGNDGSGSGLDSDLLDGNHGSWYRDYNNLTNKPSTATVFYIDVYGQGNAGDRDTARNWATSAVSVPNNTMFVVRWNRVYSYWVNNNTASGNEDSIIRDTDCTSCPVSCCVSITSVALSVHIYVKYSSSAWFVSQVIVITIPATMITVQ